MTYEFRTAADRQLMIVRHSGDVTCDEISEIAQAIDETIDAFNPPYLLIDVRVVDSLPDAQEIHAWRQQRLRRSPLVDKIAFVTSPLHSATIEALALEHINNGINVNVFFKEMDALDWLL